GLEVHDARGAARFAGHGECGDFGVLLTVPGVETLADDDAVLEQDGPDQRVRRHAAPATHGELDCPAHRLGLRETLAQRICTPSPLKTSPTTHVFTFACCAASRTAFTSFGGTMAIMPT